MTIERIFLDMDGVLADWTGSACRLLGRDPAEVYASWPEGCWDITAALGVSGNELWSAVNAAGFEFWASLEPYPWASDLVELCERTAPTTILTSPSRDPQSLAGKLAWLQAWLGEDFRDYLIGPDKLSCARRGAVLIDDRTSTVRAFGARGGAGVEFPALWNPRGRSGVGDPVEAIRADLDEVETRWSAPASGWSAVASELGMVFEAQLADRAMCEANGIWARPHEDLPAALVFDEDGEVAGRGESPEDAMRDAVVGEVDSLRALIDDAELERRKVADAIKLLGSLSR